MIIAAVASAVFLGGQLRILAQDDGPIILGKRERPPPLSLDPFHGSIDLLAITQWDSTSSAGSSSSSSSQLFQESITLATGGGIISKNFFNWKATVKAGAQENWSQHEGSGDISGFGFIHAYDISGQLLRTTEFPSGFYARRNESYTALSFQPMVKTIYSEYGANISYTSPVIPTSLNVYHTESEQSQFSGVPTYKLSEDHVEFQTVYDPNESHHLTLNYEFVAVGQENPGSILRDYETQSLRMTHDWLLDGTSRYVLTQNLSYSDQTGDFPFQYLRLSEQLRMRHTAYFQTNYDYTFDQQEFATSLAQSHQVSAGFSHQLFSSLTTNGQVGATTITRNFEAVGSTPASTADTNTYRASLAFHYTKHVPLGVLSANLGLGYNSTENSAVGSVQQVLNEPRTFSDPQPIILTRANVDPSSVTVFNSNGTRQYVEGLDYVIRPVGNTVQVERTPFTSNIGPNDLVLLNYNVDPLPAYTLTATTFSTGLRYDFNEGLLTGLGVFAQYFQQDQTTNSLSIRADNVVDTTFGADYRFWKILLSAQRQDRQSTLNAFAATRFTAQYSDRFSPRSLFSIGATHSLIEYTQTGNTVALSTIDSRLEYQISRELKAIVSARWRNNSDSRFGDTMGFEEQGELRWDIRQTQIFILIRHTTVLAPGSESMGLTTQFGISRSF